MKTAQLPEYIGIEGKDDGQRLLAQTRWGSLERWNRYCEGSKGRLREICSDEFGNLDIC